MFIIFKLKFLHFVFIQLSINIKLPATSSEYNLELDLAYPINSSKTDFKVNTANVCEDIFFLIISNFSSLIQVEVRLYKVDAIQWTSLDAQHKPNAPPSEFIY